MKEIIDLNEKNLPLLSESVSVPHYDRSQVKVGIVHVGIGGFHRAHQAFYTDKLLENTSEEGWGICGICLLERDRKMYDVLSQQNGLYTLMHKQKEGKPTAAIIGSLIEYYYAPDHPEQVIHKMANPSIKIISLTITEGGYNYEESTGAFNWNNPNVLWDKKNLDSPKTIFGYLTAALKKRKKHNLPITIQSCDNIQQNGDVMKTMLFSFMQKAAPDLLDWTKENVSFPNCMVDRITPVTTSEDINLLKKTYGINDRWPVVSESFHQWVIEDKFIAGRPSWEKVDAQFVADVHPYEKMKLRILNGGHSLLGLTGYLSGYKFIHEVVKNPLFSTFLKQFMNEEVTPTLDAIHGVNLKEYKNTVVRRFGNPYIKDTVDRIILDSSAKFPKFILPTINENLETGKPIRSGVIIVASWYCYLEKAFIENRFHEVKDPASELLFEKIKIAINRDTPLLFIEITSIFNELASSKHFAAIYNEMVKSIKEKGIVNTIKDELDKE